jgi:hypothetical protein
MPFDQNLADRIHTILNSRKIKAEEKNMMGGLTFMVNDKMCVGIVKEDLMARVGPYHYGKALKMKGAREMDFTGKPMKGFVFVAPDGIDLDEDLEKYLDMALDYNKEAKSSKKKKIR